jgi:PIN domain nuclease of toxin-antitoxin system
VNLLLDTHVVLWWRTDSRHLTQTARRSIASADTVWVSAASGWEVAIKTAIGKLRLDEPFGSMVADSGFTELPVTLEHAGRVATLSPHHHDPFDRMLVAQTQIVHATLVTHDPQFRPYDVPILWT